MIPGSRGRRGRRPEVTREVTREVTLALAGGAVRVPAELVARVEPLDRVETVPRGPAGVVGIAELRGRPVTVLDPALFVPELGSARGPELGTGASALLLAPPFDHLALLLPIGTTLAPNRAGDGESARLDARRLRGWLDAAVGEGARR